MDIDGVGIIGSVDDNIIGAAYGKTDSIKAVRDSYQQRVFKENEQHEQELKQYYNGTTVTNSDKMHQCINKFIDKVAQ